MNFQHRAEIVLLELTWLHTVFNERTLVWAEETFVDSGTHRYVYTAVLSSGERSFYGLVLCTGRLKEAGQQPWPQGDSVTASS